MVRQSIKDKLNESFANTKTLHKFDIKNGWFYVRISGVANAIIIAGTDMSNIDGIVQERETTKEVAMLEKDIYLFGRALPLDEKEKPTCFYKNLPCYGDAFIAFKENKVIHPIPFDNAIKNIEKLQFAKKSDKTIAIAMI